MTETDELNIDCTILNNYRSPECTKDYFSKTSDNRYRIVFYNIDEYRMLSYAGLFAIYKGENLDELVINSGTQWIDFDWQNTFKYLEKSDCLVFRKPSSTQNPKKGEYPFLLIKPKEMKFSFIEWDLTSVYFALEEVDINVAKIIQLHPKDISNLNIDTRQNETIQLNDIDWFDLAEFEEAIKLYHN